MSQKEPISMIKSLRVKAFISYIAEKRRKNPPLLPITYKQLFMVISYTIDHHNLKKNYIHACCHLIPAIPKIERKL